MDLSKTPTAVCCAYLTKRKRRRQRYLVCGQNANRCASFVSVGTRFLGLFRPKWLKPAAKRKSGFMLILKGFFER